MGRVQGAEGLVDLEHAVGERLVEFGEDEVDRAAHVGVEVRQGDDLGQRLEDHRLDFVGRRRPEGRHLRLELARFEDGLCERST